MGFCLFVIGHGRLNLLLQSPRHWDERYRRPQSWSNSFFKVDCLKHLVVSPPVLQREEHFPRELPRSSPELRTGDDIILANGLDAR